MNLDTIASLSFVGTALWQECRLNFQFFGRLRVAFSCNHHSGEKEGAGEPRKELHFWVR